jgi:hypothetical protein
VSFSPEKAPTNSADTPTIPAIETRQKLVCSKRSSGEWSLQVGKSVAQMSPTKASGELVKAGVPPKDGAAMVAVVENARLELVPADAESLLRWLAQARATLPAP